MNTCIYCKRLFVSWSIEAVDSLAEELTKINRTRNITITEMCPDCWDKMMIDLDTDEENVSNDRI